MQVKNRGWVKNAAIIFLSVMLVLTFFSNTIMNHSLPQVAVQRADSGPIQTAIRGTGTVVANQSFEVTLEETRQIAAIHAKAGETIEAGQLLFTLEESDSEELAAAIKALHDLELALSKKLLQMQPADYDDDTRAITQAQEDLQALIDKRDGLGELLLAAETAKAATKTAESQVKAMETRVKALEKEQAAITADIAALGSEDEFDYLPLLTDEVKKLMDDVTAAKEAQDAAQKAVDKAQAALDNAGSGGSGNSGLQSSISAKQGEIAALMVSQESQKHAALALMSAVYDDTHPEYKSYKDDPSDSNLRALFNAGHSGKIAEAVAEYFSYDSLISRAQMELSNLQNEYDQGVSSSNSNAAFQNALNAAKSKLAAAKEVTDTAQKAFDRGLKALTNTYKAKLSDKTDQIDAAKEQVEAAQEALTEVKAAQAEAEKAVGTTREELDAEIKAGQRAIEALMSSLAQKKDDERIKAAVEGLDLEAERKAIDAQEAVVARLREKAQGLEVTARYGGILTAVSCVVGDKVAAGAPLAAIDVSGKGYTTTMSVTNEQAAKVQVGVTAQVGNRWDSVMLELTAIRNDPASQGRKKILEFSVTGENVSAGQQLNISVGERDQHYQCIVPNSALREDVDGTFVLVAESKSTPLGTRYTAVRIDVTVLAADTYNTALSQDDLTWQDFVITTANKPVEAGSQVRLID